MTPTDKHSPGLRAKLREALESTNTEDELAAQITASGALGEIVELATFDAGQTAEALQIQPDSVRKLMRQSVIFPRPAINERRYARLDVQAYAQTRQKKNKGSTDPRRTGKQRPQ